MATTQKPLTCDDKIRLFGTFSATSFVGYFDRHFTPETTELEIVDYVRTNNPKLFHRLHGMRFASSDIPLSYFAHQSLKRLSSVAREVQQMPSTHNPEKKRPTDTSLESATSIRLCQTSTSTISMQNEGTAENILKDGHDVASTDGAQSPPDKVSHEVVLAAATQLYPDLHLVRKNAGRFDNGNLPYGYPPNSQEARYLRRRRQFQIEDTLANAHRIDQATSASSFTAREQGQDFVDLRLSRPAYVEPQEERYKKQGLRVYDRRKWRLEENRALGELTRLRSTKAVEPALTPTPTFYCYCREEEDEQMIWCSGEWCSIKEYHLKCLELGRSPTTEDRFFCRYCHNTETDSLEALVLDSSVEERVDSTGDMIDTSRQTVRPRESYARSVASQDTDATIAATEGGVDISVGPDEWPPNTGNISDANTLFDEQDRQSNLSKERIVRTWGTPINLSPAPTENLEAYRGSKLERCLQIG